MTNQPRMADDQHRYPRPAKCNLRPAIEDQWGAGGLIDLLGEGGWQGVAPEAHAAAAAYRAFADDVPAALGHCARGRELIDIGFADDVRTAPQFDSGRAVPLLRDGAFIPARSHCAARCARVVASTRAATGSRSV